MKVAINSLPIESGHQTRGVGYYTKNLIERLKKRPDIEIQEFSDIAEVKKADVVHYPFFDFFQRTLSLNKKFPTVVTIHDVTPLVFPDHYPPGIKGSLNNFHQRISLKNVKAIITDSNFSKIDIEKVLKINPIKVFSVPLAVSDKCFLIKNQSKLNKIKEKYQLPEGFTLFIGSVNWNKNILNLTKASLDAEMDIVLIGKDFTNKENLHHPEKKSYKEFLERYEDNLKVRRLGFVTDAEKNSLITLANVLLLPSFYEGFGLPILEAQKCGTPVVTANISSMPEVAGEGALLVDPYNVEEIKEAIIKIRDDKKIKDNLIKKGFENVKKFSWEKTIEQTIEVYRYASSR